MTTPERPSIPPAPPSTGFSIAPPSGRSVPSALRGRAFSVALVAILAVSVIGFLTGIGQERRRLFMRSRPDVSAEAPAPGYVDLRSIRRGPNARMYEGAVEAFERRLPSPLDAVQPQSAEQRAQVLADRSQRRAFDGAPPTIPHAIQADGAFECLGCHEKGAVVAGKRAPAMSHERHDNCTQCHAPPSGLRELREREPPDSRGLLPVVAPPRVENTFVGLAPEASGARAGPGAPPVIPHTTWMRSECTSCHGVSGALGMRSSHPWRQSCTQCHAPSAAKDQRTTAPEAAP